MRNMARLGWSAGLAVLTALILSGCGGGGDKSAAASYSSLVTFGDSLSDAGQFPDLTGGTAGQRFTNRDADGNFAPVSPMILGGRLGIAQDELNQSTSVGIRPDGNNWAVGGYTTQQILDSITESSKVIVPPNGPVPGFVFRERPGYLANGLRADPNALYYLTGGGNDFLQGLVNSPADAAAAARPTPRARWAARCTSCSSAASPWPSRCAAAPTSAPTPSA